MPQYFSDFFFRPLETFIPGYEKLQNTSSANPNTHLSFIDEPGLLIRNMFSNRLIDAFTRYLQVNAEFGYEVQQRGIRCLNCKHKLSRFRGYIKG
jgi:hypothetical protein